MALIRKLSQVARDPTLRRWLWRRAAGGASGPPAFTRHRPPYLGGAPAARPAPAPPVAFRPFDTPSPDGALVLPLPGLALTITPGDARDIFERRYDDIETLLALHRFAWLPLVKAVDAVPWAQALWDAWRERFAKPDDGWAWHPYTAAERAVNLLDLGGDGGRAARLPDPIDETIDILAGHADEIFKRLEYFGDHDTSNHLANNGRGLYRLGLALGLDWAADAGLKILSQEADRIFLPSGVLREGSSHYHLLITRNYIDAWLAARAYARPEAAALRQIAGRALAVAPSLVLPGGLPLIGDISPDCPPDHLIGLSGLNDPDGGWMAALSDDARHALGALMAETDATDADDLAGDGWLRAAHEPWTGLWHLAPGGWPPAPGHGHQDAGSFELHYRECALFIDPGRGAYGETGEAARYIRGRVHNTVLVDGHDPFPVNKPYYDDAFHREVGGPSPTLEATGDGVALRHTGFRRLLGVGTLKRQWRFSNDKFTIADTLDGVGRRRVTRIFVTPLDAETMPGGARLSGDGSAFQLLASSGTVRIEPLTLWRAYGEGRPGHAIIIETDATLPWSGDVRVEVL